MFMDKNEENWPDCNEKNPQYLGRGRSSKHWDAISHDSKGRWQERKEGGMRQGQDSGAIAPLGMGTRQYQ